MSEDEYSKKLRALEAEAGRLAGRLEAIQKPINITVGQILRCPAHSGGYRVWQVVGVYLGGEKQEGVAELVTLDRTENTQGRMIVPIEILETAVAVGLEVLK